MRSPRRRKCTSDFKDDSFHNKNCRYSIFFGPSLALEYLHFWKFRTFPHDNDPIFWKTFTKSFLISIFIFPWLFYWEFDWHIFALQKLLKYIYIASTFNRALFAYTSSGNRNLLIKLKAAGTKNNFLIALITSHSFLSTSRSVRKFHSLHCSKVG